MTLRPGRRNTMEGGRPCRRRVGRLNGRDQHVLKTITNGSWLVVQSTTVGRRYTCLESDGRANRSVMWQLLEDCCALRDIAIGTRSTANRAEEGLWLLLIRSGKAVIVRLVQQRINSGWRRIENGITVTLPSFLPGAVSLKSTSVASRSAVVLFLASGCLRFGRRRRGFGRSLAIQSCALWRLMRGVARYGGISGRV